MDPSKLQSDSANDVHSLEGSGTIMEDGKGDKDESAEAKQNEQLHAARLDQEHAMLAAGTQAVGQYAA